MEKKRAYAFLALAVCLFVLFPALFLSLKQNLSAVQLLLVLFNYVFAFVIFIVLFLVVQLFYRGALLKHVISFIASLYYVCVLFIIAYWAYTGSSPDLYFLGDSIRDALDTAILIFGYVLLLYLLGFLLLGAVCYFIFIGVLKALGQFDKKVVVIACALVFGLMLGNRLASQIDMPDDYLAHVLQKTIATKQTRSLVFPVFPDNGHFSSESTENVFIVQLESVNALAINGNLPFYGYNDVYNPFMREIAKDGVYFPYFFGTSMQTNRGLESILCGIVNNVGKSFSYLPEGIQNLCLPKILNDAGYTTLFFEAYNDLGFMNLEDFIFHIGFEELHSEDVMQKSDPAHSWGYDDCIFYQRVLEFLRERHPKPERLFVHIELSANHYPFDSKPGYDHLYKFKPPKNFIEDYLNSFLIQDYCLGRFYEEFKQYAADNSHLIVVPDHSIPVGVNGNLNVDQGAFNDNFIISVLYVPPTVRRHEFNIGSEIDKFYSQSDIPATVLELLSGKQYQNSFVFALQGNRKGKYEDCHVMTQPYNGAKVAIVKGWDKFVYSIDDGSVVYYDLKTDLFEKNPQFVESLAYDDFYEKYFCKRFKRAFKAHNLFTGPIHLGDDVITENWDDYWQVFSQDTPFGLDFEVRLNGVKGAKKLRIEAADVDAMHSVFIDGQFVGRMCTGSVAIACNLELDGIVVRDGSFLRIENSDLGNGNYDDFIVYSVQSIG
jgi:hypothetical protein